MKKMFLSKQLSLVFYRKTFLLYLKIQHKMWSIAEKISSKCAFFRHTWINIPILVVGKTSLANKEHSNTKRLFFSSERSPCNNCNTLCRQLRSLKGNYNSEYSNPLFFSNGLLNQVKQIEIEPQNSTEIAI